MNREVSTTTATPTLQSIVDVIEKCASKFNLPIVNVFGLMTSDHLRPDGLHPGVDGHEELFRAIAPVVFGLPALNV